MIAAPTPGVGVSLRCLFIGAPLTAALWAIILTAIVPSFEAPFCGALVEGVHHG